MIHGKDSLLQISPCCFIALLSMPRHIFCIFKCFALLSFPDSWLTDFEFVQAEGSVPSSIVPSQGDEGSRFLGDLNPEGIFLAATSPDATRGMSKDSIGVW